MKGHFNKYNLILLGIFSKEMMTRNYTGVFFCHFCNYCHYFIGDNQLPTNYYHIIDHSNSTVGETG